MPLSLCSNEKRLPYRKTRQLHGQSVNADGRTVRFDGLEPEAFPLILEISYMTWLNILLMFYAVPKVKSEIPDD